MKLYTAGGPNPRVVDLFLAEKGLAGDACPLERVAVDIGAREHLESGHVARNALGQVPVLELDDGSCISQVTAICEYLEELHPDPPLIGATPQERAQTRMWMRRLDLLVLEPMTLGFRNAEGLFFYRDRIHAMPHAADDLKAMARRNLAWLDGQLGEGPFIRGPRFTLADIQLFSFLDFGERYGQPLDGENHALLGWREAVRERLEHGSQRGEA